jgi:hypothetical protein
MTTERRAWIDEPGDEDSPELERATRVWRQRRAPVPGIMAVLKQAPAALATVNRMTNAVSFGGSTLGRVREELIATCTSALNDCFY